MVALPEAHDTELGADALDAYRACLRLEKKAATEHDAMHARLLGYLILHAPIPTRRQEIVKEVHSCNQDHGALSQLGEAFLNYFIRPCKLSADIICRKQAELEIQLNETHCARQRLRMIALLFRSIKSRWICWIKSPSRRRSTQMQKIK